MTFRGWIDRLNDSRSVAHGVVSTGLVAGLALIDPRRLTTGRRLAYRGAVAVVTAWVVWASLRPRAGIDPLGQVGRAAVSTGAAGTALGLAEAGEALDARLHDRLARAGASRPRVWIAVGEAVVTAVSWWVNRVSDRVEPEDLAAQDGSDYETVDLPEDLHAVAALILSATDEHGAPRLREQLATAQTHSFDEEDGEPEFSFAQLKILEGLPRAVPGTGMFPVIGRFRAIGDRTFDVRLYVDSGRLLSIAIEEGADWTIEELEAWSDAGHDVGELTAWPQPHEIELFIETETGYSPLSA